MSQFQTPQLQPQSGQVPFQVGPFQPISIYDAPGQLFSQLWDREFSVRGARNVFLAPENLTPKERDTIHSRLKAAAGNNSVTSALIDVALNPWVWLFVITSPVGADATGGIFKVAAKYSSRVAENSGLLGGWHWLSIGPLTRDTAIGATAADIGKSLRKIHDHPASIRFQTALEDVVDLNGLSREKGINWTRYADGSAEQKVARSISSMLEIELGGLAKEWSRQFVKEVREGATGSFQNLSHPTKQLPVYAGKPLAALRRFKGGDKLARTARSMFDGIRDTIYENPNALVKMFRGHADRNTLGMLKTAEGRLSPAETILGQAESKSAYAFISDRLANGEKMSKILKEIENTFMAEIRQANYFPRNVWETWEGGAKITGNDFYIGSIFSHGVRPDKTTLARLPSANAAHHPDDIRFITESKLLSLTKHGKKVLKNSEAALKSGRRVRFQRMNAGESIERWIDGQARTFAMFVDDVGDEALAINRLTRENVPKGQFTYAPGVGGAVPIERAVVGSLKDAAAPLGGFSHADLLAGEIAVLKDKDTIRVVRDNVVPMLMGRLTMEHNIALRSLNVAKTTAKAFTQSTIGQAVRGSGDFGKQFVKRLDDWANIAPETEVGRDVRLLAKYLYNTHLGLNVASAIVNSTQPILLVAPILGAKHVLNGYREYFKDWSKYMKIRQSQGFRPLSAVERDKVQRQSFRMVDEMGIAANDLETLEAITFAKKIKSTKPDSLAQRIFFEYPMKLFAQVEWMNRGVTAHAMRSRWIADRGFDPLTLVGRVDLESRLTLATFKNEARRLTDETQFGGHFFNTPEVFLPSTRGTNIAANPLARQFMQFPLKQFTAVAHVLPHLAGTERPFRTFANFAGRGMAFSALGYELTKNLLNANYERAGFFASSTDIIPLVRDGRFDGTESPIPIPPILQIPVDLVRGFAEEDKQLLGYAFARTIPGGIGLSRLLGIAPKVPDVIDPLNLQRTFVAWNQRRADGTVPFFKGDGTLIGFEDPKVLVLKGLGADLGRFRSQGQLDRFLVAQGEEQRKARREAITAILGNNTAKARRIMADFKRRTGFDLTISRDQLRSALRMREVGRSERILERMPADSKELFRDIILQSRGEFQGIPPEQFESGRTIKERGPRPSTLQLDPNTIQMIQQLIDDKQQPELPGSTPGDSGFASFGIF